ncbi:MAG: hypothetical protein M3158_08275 [Pseudomonadota bacterium]|jgi:hypothetical protein|nr:hypothetical protein [Pseudomonadota bacterium]
MSLLSSRERTSPRTEAEEFFRQQGARSPVGPFLLSVALLNVTSVIFALASH